MAAEQGRARGKASAATATRVQNALIDGSLCGILERLDEDPAFHRLVSGGMSIADGKDIAPIITVGTPDGLRPAIAAAQAEHTPVVLVVASSREAEDTVNALRSWYGGDPNDIAQLRPRETLPHERLSPRADTVASRMAVFRRLTHPSDTNPMFGPIRILVMPVRSLIQPVVKGLGDVDPLVFTQGEELPLDDVSRRLVENAYTRVDLVMDRGEFAVRGGIIDVFPQPRHIRCASSSSVTRSTPSENSTRPTSAPTARASVRSGRRPAVNCSSPTPCGTGRNGSSGRFRMPTTCWSPSRTRFPSKAWNP